jgi:site-specific recombinase XerD
MDKEIIPVDLPVSLGEVANQFARATVLEDYQARKSAQTLRRQRADIALFEQFLESAGNQVKGLSLNLEMWQGITWGLVEAFNRWQLQKAYATGSINVRLATIKSYCELAAKAGYLSHQELALIKTVKGYRASEARNVDEKRTQTRQEGAKKALPVSLSLIHANLLKDQPKDTPRGRRDALIMHLLLDHGLRVSEVAALNIGSINLQTGELVIYRHKTDKTQIHQLTPGTYKAAQAYLTDCSSDQGPLFIGICSKARVDTSSINARVGQLGEAMGIKGLSPHDCRHYYATDAIRNGTDIKSLQDAGGWNSPAMPLRYAESAKVANSGVKLSAYRGE